MQPRMAALPANAHLPAPWQLRVAALLNLGALAAIMPLQVYYAQVEPVAKLWPAYLLQLLLAALLAAASYTRLAARYADALSVIFLLGLTADVFLGQVLAPNYPALSAFGFSCILIGSAVFFAWSTRRVVLLAVLGGLAFVLLGLAQRSHAPPETPFLMAAAMLGFGAAISVAGAEVLTRYRASLARRQTELAALSFRLMSLQEEERRRLSRELHDDLGGSLTGLSSYLWLAERKLPEGDSEVRAHVVDARRLASQTLAHMRELSHLLRPSVLDDLGLVPSLDAHLEAFGKRHEITTRLDADELIDRLPLETETALFRIAQEALTNVARHAHAQHVRVVLAVEPELVRLEIEDDGVGLPTGNGAEARRGLGLVGIRERALALGGTLEITSKRGTRIVVRVPRARGEAE